MLLFVRTAPAPEVASVQGERVVAPCRAAVGHVHPDIRAVDVGQGVPTVERVHRREMRGCRPMPHHPHPRPARRVRTSDQRRRCSVDAFSGVGQADPSRPSRCARRCAQLCEVLDRGVHPATNLRATDRPSGRDVTRTPAPPDASGPATSGVGARSTRSPVWGRRTRRARRGAPAGALSLARCSTAALTRPPPCRAIEPAQRQRRHPPSRLLTPQRLQLDLRPGRRPARAATPAPPTPRQSPR